MRCSICKEDLSNMPIQCYGDKQHCGKVCLAESILSDGNTQFYNLIEPNQTKQKHMLTLVIELQERRYLMSKRRRRGHIADVPVGE